MSPRVVRRFASWIALLALLAVTFMPTIAGVLSARGGSADVCSAASSHTVPPSEGHHPLGHCPYCALHAELALPTVPIGAAPIVATRFSERPAAFLRAPRATGVWSTSQPRAPPFFA